MFRQGLSPRVRGNRSRFNLAADKHGPIPAGAGEPCLTVTPACMGGAYPRGCGGTWQTWMILAGRGGLSPRVRGNPGVRRSALVAGGPIPAGAGEPLDQWLDLQGSRAYPRGCGGTFVNLAGINADGGLSPRVRGNRIRCRRYSPGSGPIPAGAGEPVQQFPVRVLVRAYPGGCGGT